MSEAETTRIEHAGQAGHLSVVTTTTDDGIRVLTLAGEIDHHTGDTLRHALDASGTPRPRIVADMRQVTFMDSSGINILIAAHRALSEAGGWLRLAAAGESVRRTLSIVGVDALIDCHETLRHALTN
ncbi:STAS domain-containing protein [Streptomyces lavenduligriseus]|nr:STAS domain-containing protein [Streptomyces lavenduligriseus]